MKKRLLSVCIGIAIVIGMLAGCGAKTASSSSNGVTATPASNNSETTSDNQLGAPQNFKFGLTVANTHPYAIAAQNFAKLVEEKSGGNMKVDLFYDSSLGDDAALLEALQMDGVTFALMGPAGVQTLNSMYNFFDLPCLFSSRDAAYAFQESETVQKLLTSLSGSGIIGLGFYENGFYAMTNNIKPITTVDDIKDMKMRSMTSDMAIKAWDCLGAQPVPISFGELFLALQQGVVDGEETTIGSIYTSKFYEVQKYLTPANRVFHVMTFLMSNTAWEGLTQAQQKILMEAMAESKASHKDYMTSFNADAIKDMQDNHGVQISELADGEFERMKEVSQPIYDMVRNYDPDTYDALMAAAETANADHPAN